MKKGSFFKKSVRQVHLWLGLLAGLVLSIVGVTGSLYVFEPEIAAHLEKEKYSMAKDSSMFSNDMEMALFVERISNQQIESIQWPKRGRQTYIYKFFEDDHWYFFDQSTGELAEGEKGLGNSIFNFILDLHMNLTLGEPGRVITGTASLVFAFFMLTTGLYLWWPTNKGRRKSSFRIKWDASPKRFNYDLHNINGFYFSLPLFLIGLTGAAFYFDEEVQGLVDAVTFSEPAPSFFLDTKMEYDMSKDFLPIDSVLVAMQLHYPDYYKRNLWMTKERDGTLSFAYQKRVDVYPGADTRIFLKADPYTGRIVAERHPDYLPRGTSIVAKWHLPIHFGEFGGIITRILWFVAGLMPALLTYTGVKIWLGRNKKKTQKIRQISPS